MDALARIVLLLSTALWACGRLDFAPAVDAAADRTPDADRRDASGPPGPMVAAGGFSACATTGDRVLYCWGDQPPGDGQGGGTHAVPALVSGLSDVRQLDLHGARYGVDGAGALWVWGLNDSGQLGDGTTEPRLVPWQLDLGGLVRTAASGYGFGCALRSAGTVACWGEGSRGKLGNGGTTSSLVPVEVVGLTDAVTLEAGDTHACAVRADRSVVCWGDNGAGQLGVTGPTLSASPVAIDAGGPFTQVAVGDTHACALRPDGAVVCWGDNAVGQLGRASPSQSAQPLQVPGLNGAIGVTANARSTCALLADRTAVCWGGNTYGELGDGTYTSRSTPAPVRGLTELVALSGRAGLVTCALDGAARVWCWGSNTSGALAQAAVVVDSPVPIEVSLPR